MGSLRRGPHLDSFVKEEWHKDPVEFKSIRGFKIFLDPLDDIVSPMIGVTGDFEPGVRWAIKKTLRAGDTMADVGANLGWHMLVAAKIVGDDGQVMAFEPVPEKFKLLQRSVEANASRNVRLFQEVASDVDGTKVLNLYDGGNKSLFSTNTTIKGRASQTTPVPSAKLDSVAERLGIDRFNLVKIDANGGEPEVIHGVQRLIEEGRVLHIALEWSPLGWTAEDNLLSKLFRKYSVYLVNAVGFRGLTRLEAVDLPDSMVNLFLRKR